MELAKCPCGCTPSAIVVVSEDQSKWSYACGDCCGDWHIEFRSNYFKSDDARLQILANEAWNNTTRG